MNCLFCLLGLLLLTAALPLEAAKQTMKECPQVKVKEKNLYLLNIGNPVHVLSNFMKWKAALTAAGQVLNEEHRRLNKGFSNAGAGFRDVLSDEGASGFTRERNRLNGWSSDEHEWDEDLYPVWKRGDPRWDGSWKGGHVRAVLTSDSPALVGSNITFVVTLVLPRCQKEDDNGNIVYEKNCRNGTGAPSDPYVYNWTAWAEDGDRGNGTDRSYHVFPDGRPFPHHHRRRGSNLVYVFHTLGQYYQKLGRCSASVSVNTANITVGPQLMEVAVYRRKGRTFVPVAKAKDAYVVTDKIPVSVTMSQKNDRNASDETFLRDIPIVFDVFLHDPSHFLNESAVHYKWNFGDNTGLFVSLNHTLNHTYVLNGTFSLNLTVEAPVPGPCPPPPTPRPPKPTRSLTPTGDSPLQWAGTAGEGCQIVRDGDFTARLTVVDGILEVNIIETTEVVMPVPQPGDALMDFVVTCRGTPTEVCTVVADPTCQVAQDAVCSPADGGGPCLLTVRRAFAGAGTYCLNLTLGDAASLAVTSTLVSVPGRNPGPSVSMASGALVSVGCLALIVTAIALVVYKKRKDYKPIENGTGIKGNGLDTFLEQAKVKFFPGSQEKDPLLKNQPGTP